MRKAHGVEVVRVSDVANIITLNVRLTCCRLICIATA